MSPNKRRAISWAIGIGLGTVIFLIFLNSPVEMDADGTLESRGTGNALTLLVTIGATYLVTLLFLEWRYRPKSSPGAGED